MKRYQHPTWWFDYVMNVLLDQCKLNPKDISRMLTELQQETAQIIMEAPVLAERMADGEFVNDQDYMGGMN
jgi:hypothetical protein